MNDADIPKLIFIPAVVTLAVTLLRLAGELAGGSNLLFSTEAGGAFALIGIAWLVPLFGIYFGWKLGKSSGGVSPARAIGYPVLALGAGFGLGMLVFSVVEPLSVAGLISFGIATLGSMLIASLGWKELFQTLVWYGVAARIPVVIVMFFAIWLNLGTHYDAPPPEFPTMPWLQEWILTGVIPQLTFWLAFTVIIGGLFGGLTLLVARRKTVA